MDIWLINHYAVPPKYYPLARQTYFAKHLMKMGHTVKIFAASTVHNSDLNLITDHIHWREDVVDGVTYVLIKCHGYHGNGIRRIYNMCEFAMKLPKVCKNFTKPDAIVSTSMPPVSCAQGIRLARKYKCKGIAEIADLWPESLIVYGIAKPYNPIVLALRKLEKWIYIHANAIVFTAEGGYEYILGQHWEKRISQSKVHYINNGVDLETFCFNRDNFRIEDEDLEQEDTFKIVYTGSIRKVNNLGLLLEVAKHILDPRIVFLVWGDGDELSKLKQQVIDEQIDNVVFKGKVEKKYIPYIVSKANLNIMHGTPSPMFQYGISPNKLFDYLAAGKPILSDFPCKYNPAVQCGAGTEVGNPTAENIAKEIVKYASLDSTSYSACCERAIQGAKEYDFSRLTEKLLIIIDR